MFVKSCSTVTRQWLEVTRPSADCQTTFFGRFKQSGKILKKVAERSRDSGRRSRDCLPTVKQRFLYHSSNQVKFWEKSLNGHATVVGGHATVGRLSNNVFGRFKQLGKILKKSHWTVTRQWSEVTRPSADCQTTIFRRFKQLEFFLKKVAKRSRDSGRRSRDRRPTVKQRFLNVSSDLGKFWKKSLNGHATVVGGHATVGWLSNNVFGSFKQFGRILKKSRNGHATVVGGHATVGRLSNNVFWTFQAIIKVFEKSRWTVTRQWSEVTRPSDDCQTTFLGRFKRFGKILKKVAERSRDSGWGHATVGRLSNNVFWTFQAIWKIFEKSRWTVTRQWSEVTRPSDDCQTTFLGRFKRFGKILKKVAERSRDSGWGHATVGRLSNNVFWTFQAIRKIFEKSHWTVTRQWSEVTRPSDDCQTTFLGRFKRFGKILKKVAERSRDSGWGHATVGRLSNNVFGRFKQLEKNLKKKSQNGHATVVGGHATVGWLSNNVFGRFKQLGNFL